MVSNVLLYQTSSLHSIVSYLIIRIVYMLIRSRVQIHCDSFIHSSRVSKIHHQPCHVVYTDYRPVPLQHYVYPTGAEGLYLVVDEKGKVGLLLCLLLCYIYNNNIDYYNCLHLLLHFLLLLQLVLLLLLLLL